MTVTKELWEHVVRRDAYNIWLRSEENIHHHVTFQRYMTRRRKRPLCIVELLMPLEVRDCAGRTTVDHVKDDLMMGKKAPDDEWHLTATCEYHNVWHPPSKALRQAQRAYLADCRRAAAEQGRSGDEPEVEEPA